jgi:hypothetical protein
MECLRSWCRELFPLINAYQEVSATTSAHVDQRAGPVCPTKVRQDLHDATELLVSKSRGTLDLILHDLGHAQLEHQTVKLCRDSRRLLTV